MISGGLSRPRVDQPHYGGHLGDPGYWQPYVEAVLNRHSFPLAPLEPPFVGTFPTFLVGELVVKLFGDAFHGPKSYSAELGIHRLLSDHPEIPAPAVVKTGCLFADDPRWPYLVTERLSGLAIRDANLDLDQSSEIASSLGAVVASLHKLKPPSEVEERDLLPELRATAPDRLRRFGLPERLVGQVSEYLSDSLPPSVLVHADITADHVFVERERLVGVIDWGDAIVADPYYELVAVYLDSFRGRPLLLERFLESYSWVRNEDFPRRALQGVLEFQFDSIGRVGELIELDRLESLDDLAMSLFGDLYRRL